PQYIDDGRLTFRPLSFLARALLHADSLKGYGSVIRDATACGERWKRFCLCGLAVRRRRGTRHAGGCPASGGPGRFRPEEGFRKGRASGGEPPPLVGAEGRADDICRRL